jgi:site-specific recombinase XerC
MSDSELAVVSADSFATPTIITRAGPPAHYSPHSFRATLITNVLENDGTLEAAQRIAGHADI